MCKSFLSGYLVVDEIDFEALLVRKNIAEIIQDEFAREMNRLVYREARRNCQGCQMDDLSQMKHECMMKEEEEIWICHYDVAKRHLNVDKLWSAIEKEILVKLDANLENAWLKYLLQLIDVDETTAFLLYKDYQRKRNEENVEDLCLKLRLLGI